MSNEQSDFTTPGSMPAKMFLNRYGHLLITANNMKDIYVQVDREVDEYLESLSMGQIQDLNNGYEIDVEISDEYATVD